MAKTIAISDETHKKLLKLKGLLTARTGEIFDFDKTIRWLLEIAKEKVMKNE